MAIKAADIRGILIERIEGSHPEPALFSATETDEWPAEVLDALLNCGILQRAYRAESTWCPGCEWQCHKGVVVTTACAFIACNEEPDFGRIFIPLRDLVQYSTNFLTISRFISDQMALGHPRPSAAGASFLLGSVRGRKGPCQTTVALDSGRLLLRVGMEQECVVQVLLWDGVRLSIDDGLVRRLANRKGAALPSLVSRSPDRSLRHANVRRTNARHRAIFAEAQKRRTAGEGSWTAIAANIASTNLALVPNGRRLSDARVRRIVTEMRKRERESFRSNHHTRNPL